MAYRNANTNPQQATPVSKKTGSERLQRLPDPIILWSQAPVSATRSDWSCWLKMNTNLILETPRYVKNASHMILHRCAVSCFDDTCHLLTRANMSECDLLNERPRLLAQGWCGRVIHVRQHERVLHQLSLGRASKWGNLVTFPFTVIREY